MWCGEGPFKWMDAGTLNPCVFASCASVTVLLLAAASASQSYYYLQSLSALGNRSYLWSLPGSKRPQIIQASAAIFLSVFHFFVLAILAGGFHPAPFLITSEVSLFLTWLSLSVFVLWAVQRDACLRLQVISWTTASIYSFSFYSELQFYFHGFGDSPMQRSVRLGASLLSTTAAIVFLVAELQKPPPPSAESSAALREALLSPFSATSATEDDVENNRNTNKLRKRNRSWVSLVGIAAKYMWPTGFWLRVRAGICVALIVALRLLNLAVPITYKKVIDEFSKLTSLNHPDGGGGGGGGDEPPDADPVSFGAAFFPWVFTWLVLYFLQGGGGGGGAVGLLSNFRSYLWIPIGQASFRRASLDIFGHVLSMDHHFHLHRKTGELLRIMDRGTASIQTLLGTVLFQIGPAIFDITAAAVFLALRLKAWIAAIVFTTLGAYIPMTIIITEWRGN